MQGRMHFRYNFIWENFLMFFIDIYKYIINISKYWQIYEYNDNLHVSQYLVVLATSNKYRKKKENRNNMLI